MRSLHCTASNTNTCSCRNDVLEKPVASIISIDDVLEQLAVCHQDRWLYKYTNVLEKLAASIIIADEVEDY
jgi:hypothetical protein